MHGNSWFGNTISGSHDKVSTFNETISSLWVQFTGKYFENFDMNHSMGNLWNCFVIKSIKFQFILFNVNILFLRFSNILIFSYFQQHTHRNSDVGIKPEGEFVKWRSELANEKGGWLLGCELVIIKYFDILFIFMEF